MRFDTLTRFRLRDVLRLLLAGEHKLEEALDRIEDVFGREVDEQTGVTPDQIPRPALGS